MKLTRRKVLKSMTATGALAASPGVFAPAIAQAKPCKIGILAPRTGIAASPGISGLKATEWAVETLQCAGRHRRPQDRAGDRGRDVAQGHHRALPEARAAGEGRLRAGHHLDRRGLGAGPGGGGVARAHDLLGRHHPGRRRREAAERALSLQEHRQRVRGRDVLAARDQALEGPVQAHRRHQPGLLLRPQQHGGVRRAAEALQYRARGRHRAVAEGRHDGADQPRRGAQGRQARPHLLLAAVRRPAGVHEAGDGRRADQGHQAGVPGGRLAAHA